MSIREDIERPLTAYEELLIWCQRHLPEDGYKVVPESRSFCTTIYFAEYADTGLGMVCFAPSGSVAGFGTLNEDDMIEHIEDYERTKEAPKPDPMPTSIGGMMVRKMIEAYERQTR
jgi:hypothetical protein